MPTYEYQCDRCLRVFDVRQRISEPALTTCEACGGNVRRLLSATPFILKGGGWYVTDYPSESRKKAMESEKKSSAGKSSSETPSSEKPSAEKPSAEKPSAEKSSSASNGSSSSASTSASSSASTSSSSSSSD